MTEVVSRFFWPSSVERSLPDNAYRRKSNPNLFLFVKNPLQVGTQQSELLDQAFTRGRVFKFNQNVGENNLDTIADYSVGSRRGDKPTKAVVVVEPPRRKANSSATRWLTA
jgi:hypothetical protein